MPQITYPENIEVTVEKSWLKACGKDTEKNIFEVISIEDFGYSKRQDISFREFYTVKDTFGTWRIAHGRTTMLSTIDR